MNLRLGIIGLGNMGTSHLKNILAGKCPEIDVTAIADRNEGRLKFAQEQLGDRAVYFAEGSELIASDSCDAVLLSVPHYQHPKLAVDSFRHAKHVMSEKPAGVYTLAVRAAIDEADRHPDLVFGMMFNQRTNCVYRKMKDMVDAGEVGDIKRVNWIITDWYRTQYYYDSGAWRATWAGEGGGVLLNQCPHQLDLLQWICGLPVRVQAHMAYGKWHDIEVEDDVTAYMEFANGATGVFVTTTGDAPGTNRFEITGSKGTLICENDQLTFRKLTVDEREWCVTCKEGFKKPPFETYQVETDGQNAQHPEVLNAFADRILHGGMLLADGREGIRGLMLSNAMHLSAWLDQMVTLPIDEALFEQELGKLRAASRLKATADVVSDTSGSY